MANTALTCTLAYCGTFALPASGAQPFRPFTQNANGTLNLSGTLISPPLCVPIGRIRLRAPNATNNAATVLYGTLARHTNQLLASNTAGAMEHIGDPTQLYFTGTQADVVEVDIFV